MSIGIGNMYDAGIRKAAILVASLDPATADLLLDQLDPECADQVRLAVMDVDEIDARQRQRVIDEFYCRGSMIPDQSPPGIELDSPLGQTLLSAVAQSPCHSERSEESGRCEILRCDQDDGHTGRTSGVAAPFSFLHEAEEAKLCQLLNGERPQTIALVLSHLPPQRSGEVLARFAPPLQVEVVRRLADLQNADPETLREIEQALETRFSRQFAIERSQAAGPETAERILAACPGRVAAGILGNLATCDMALAERLGHRQIEFDDLNRFDTATLLAVFRAAEPELTQAALLGAPPAFVERILAGMSEADAMRLRRKLDCPGPIRLRDIDEAKRQIAALTQRMLLSNSSGTAAAA
jgi:flagellar motor switch protein FliG